MRLHRVDLVNQDVAAVARTDHAWGRARISRDDDRAIRSCEPIAKRLRHLAVPDGERVHRHILVLIHDAWADLVDIDLVPAIVVLREVPLHPFRANFDVVFPRLEKVVGHRSEAARSVDLYGPGPPDAPRCEDEIGIPDGVIRMEMRYERRFELREMKSFHSIPVRG